MSNNSPKERLLALNPTIKYVDLWLDIVSRSHTVDEMKSNVSESVSSLDVYQVLQPMFELLAEQSVASDLITKVIEEGRLPEYHDQLVYYLSKMGAQPYPVLSMMMYCASHGDDFEDDKDSLRDWQNTRGLGEKLLEDGDMIFDEGISIMLLVFREYLGFDD